MDFKPKVLIAEDDPNLRQLIGIYLKKLEDKYEFIIVNDGLQAIEIMKKEGLNLLVTDLKMPKIEGLVLISYLNRNFPDIPCIVMTSLRGTFLKEKLQKDVMFYLEKPFTKDIFINAIKDALNCEHISGSLQGISPASFIQLINLDQKTCVCEVERTPDLPKGRLFFKDGQLFNAEYEKFSGEAAAIEMLRFERVTINFIAASGLKIEKRIKSSINALIMEAMRQKDETLIKDDKLVFGWDDDLEQTEVINA